MPLTKLNFGGNQQALVAANIPTLTNTQLPTISSAKMPAGSVLQVVTNTSVSTVSNSSTTAIDLISASITPKESNSLIMIKGYQGHANITVGSSNAYGALYIVDPSSNVLAGAFLGTAAANSGNLTVVGFHSPSSTSSQTYKLRMSTGSGGTNTNSTDGQRYTIELSEIRV